MAHPFVHTFKHLDRYYVYDVNTNGVVEVDELLYELLALVDIAEDNGTIRIGLAPSARMGLLERFPPPAVEAALTTVEDAYRDHRLFSSERASAMRFPFSRDEMEILYRNIVRHVILCVTERCNLRCRYCAYSGTYEFNRQHSARTMTRERACEAVRFLVAHSSYLLRGTDMPLTVGFYGGEPLLNMSAIRACFDCVRSEFSAIENRITFAMTSNLTIDNPSALESLAEHNVELMVSLDGPAAIHDRYRVSAGGGGSFSRVTENLKRLERNYPEYYRKRVAFSAVLHPPYDLHAVADFFEHCGLVRGHRVVFSPVDQNDTTFLKSHGNAGAERLCQICQLQDRFLSEVKAGGQKAGSVLGALVGVSGSLKGIHFRRFAGGPGSRTASSEHAHAPAAA